MATKIKELMQESSHGGMRYTNTKKAKGKACPSCGEKMVGKMCASCAKKHDHTKYSEN